MAWAEIISLNNQSEQPVFVGEQNFSQLLTFLRDLFKDPVKGDKLFDQRQHFNLIP